jgi:hypothetical protein
VNQTPLSRKYEEQIAKLLINQILDVAEYSQEYSDRVRRTPWSAAAKLPLWI